MYKTRLYDTHTHTRKAHTRPYGCVILDYTAKAAVVLQSALQHTANSHTLRLRHEDVRKEDKARTDKADGFRGCSYMLYWDLRAVYCW